MTVDVELVDVSKKYGDFQAVENCSLMVEQGEFISLLGPSGCGKTTTLNMIAGFFEPTNGEVRIRGNDVTRIPPNKREVGMVFQNYALFPHMTVSENVAFGLQMKKLQESEISRRVMETLALVHMEEFAERYPRQLSGGQQQRVALARAVAPRPSVLLLDEPLSNLDLKLRESMRRELKSLQRDLGVTAIFVTHDQDEALTMSDRVVVMNSGRVEQIGSPAAVYARPNTRFVAGFVGQMNFIEAVVEVLEDGMITVRAKAGSGRFSFQAGTTTAPGQDIVVGIRPEALRMLPGSYPDSGSGKAQGIDGILEEIVSAGSITQAYVETGSGETLRIDMLNGSVPVDLGPKDRVHVTVPPEHVVQF